MFGGTELKTNFRRSGTAVRVVASFAAMMCGLGGRRNLPNQPTVVMVAGLHSTLTLTHAAISGLEISSDPKSSPPARRLV